MYDSWQVALLMPKDWILNVAAVAVVLLLFRLLHPAEPNKEGPTYTYKD